MYTLTWKHFLCKIYNLFIYSLINILFDYITNEDTRSKKSNNIDDYKNIDIFLICKLPISWSVAKTLNECLLKPFCELFSFTLCWYILSKLTIGNRKVSPIRNSSYFSIRFKADQGVHTFSLTCRQFSSIFKNNFIFLQ